MAPGFSLSCSPSRPCAQLFPLMLTRDAPSPLLLSISCPPQKKQTEGINPTPVTAASGTERAVTAASGTEGTVRAGSGTESAVTAASGTERAVTAASGTEIAVATASGTESAVTAASGTERAVTAASGTEGTHVQNLHALFRTYRGSGHTQVLHPMPGSRSCGGSAHWIGLPALRSPVHFAEESLRPTPGASEIISFGAEEGNDLDEAMSLTASEKDRAQASEERSEVEGHTAFQDKLVRILTRAVSDLGLEWEKADEPARSKPDSWFLDSGRRAAALRKRAPSLPDLHDEVAKAWAAPQSARTHAGGSEIFTKVDGAETRGYTRIPPTEESIAAHLCPSSALLKSGASCHQGRAV
ncbi:kinase C alpha type-like protein [Labeo rohita]|uniref:Kinase C alpha type-like protein n=1 Tax=Labeo rohita TaxID=84645 RepID=A0A498MXL9_LABRO|nr:kinase C alpha type-like protein [Labeo rohita]